MSMSFCIESVATVKSPFTQKFGIPRQPGLVNEVRTELVLHDIFSQDAVRGLEEFDYIWVCFVFHDAVDEGWSELVRPPRLGGKTKKGVFATRSPHRPNHLGLSLLKLEDIRLNKPVTLICSGGDLLDGTPVIDIKPYIPFVEAKANAQSGFVDGAPPLLEIEWSAEALLQLQQFDLNRKLIENTVAQDPRPAYQNIPDRVYFMCLDGYEIRFTVVGKKALIVFITKQ